MKYLPYVICTIFWAGFLGYLAYADHATVKMNAMLSWILLGGAAVVALIGWLLF